MTEQRVFLLRHWQTTFNASFDAGRGDPGDVDARLTAVGHEQVRAMAARVQALGVEVVVTSPTTRALETTMGLFAEAAAHPKVVVEALVRDRFAGDSCDIGRSPGRLAAEFPALSFGHLSDDWWHPGEGLEFETRERFAGRIETLREWLLRRPEQSLLVVGHDGTFRYLAGVRMGNCELLEWDVEHGLR